MFNIANNITHREATIARWFQLLSRGRAPVARHFNPLAVYHFGIRLNRNDLFTVFGFGHLAHLLSRVRTACPVYTVYARNRRGHRGFSMGYV